MKVSKKLQSLSELMNAPSENELKLYVLAKILFQL